MAGIYVERLIQTDMLRLWHHTQTPELHERWDARFSAIRYLPRGESQAHQRFLYETRIGFGVRITGVGETVGETSRPDGARSSKLKFWSSDWKSLITQGSGYWRYVPVTGGIRFITYYDYSTRYGLAGRILDLAFRPLLGWATARSFDVLGLWLESNIEPEAVGLRPRAGRCLRKAPSQ